MGAGSTFSATGRAAERFTFEPHGQFDSLRSDWDLLAERSDNVFATHEWLSTWWRHFGRNRRLLLTAVRDGDGELVAILPLYVATARPVRVVRQIGHGATDQLGPICAVADRDRAMAAMHQFLTEVTDTRWGLAIADDLPPAARPTGARLLARSPTHVVSLENVTGKEWLDSRSSNLRTQLARNWRGLERTGSISFRTADEPGRLEDDVDLLIDLHHRHWTRRGGSRAFTGREAFHHDLAQTFLDRGWLRLRFLEVDGIAVAAVQSFRFAGVESHYQGGRDPAFDQHSVGLLLHRHAIEACADEGVREYRFLRGDESYKRRFADLVVDQQSLAWSRGPAGRVALDALARLPRLTRAQARWVPASLAWGTGGTPRCGPP